MGWKNIFFAVSLLGSLVAPAYTNGKLVNVQVQKAYLPIGFDDNDRVQIAVAGTFHDSCYTISTTGVLVSEATKTIHLWQSAFRRTGLCLQIPIPFSQVVNVGKLEAANYSLKDGFTGQSLGALPVTRAIRPGPDDYIYAPLTDASIREDGFWSQKLVLEGVWPSSCFVWREVKVYYYKDVIVVQPIVDVLRCEPGERCGCKPESLPFQKEVSLNISFPGIYFLHARSMNGQAINKMVQVRFDDPPS